MRARIAAMASVAFLLSGCGPPSFELIGNSAVPVAPAGPSVAEILSHVKCELWQAANDDTDVLPYYNDTLDLKPHPLENYNLARAFTMKGIFEEIEYIAEAKLTLDITDSAAINPSVDFIHPLKVANTNYTLAVGAQVYGSAHRTIDIFQSIDFERLVKSPVHHYYRDGIVVGDRKFTFKKYAESEKKAARPYPPPESADQPSCADGLGLHGSLGLKEIIATSLIAARMQDAAVLTQPSSSSPTVSGQPVSVSGLGGYTFGQFDSQIDFTISADLNVGPNWTINKFKGPNVTSEGGSNGAGLLNGSRQVKDTLIITIMPVCIRQKYFPKGWIGLTPNQLVSGSSSSTPSFTGGLRGEVDSRNRIDARFGLRPDQPPKDQLPTLTWWEYDPPMNYGTPIWANQLPPCRSAAGQAARLAGPAAARTNNQLEGIDNLLRASPRFR